MKKYIAQIIIEATTTLVVGSGKSSLDNDAIVAKDWNFLPYIPGTGLLGVISSLYEKKYDLSKRNELFGGKDKDYIEEKTFKGSLFEISDALLLNENGEVHQQMILQTSLSDYHKRFLKLPKREHAKIDYKGVVADTGKFDNEFVYKGARFKFEIELQGDNMDAEWKSILDSFSSTDFMLGSGTTNNYGQIKVVSLKTKEYDLGKEEDMIAYLDHTVDLNKEFEGTEYKISKEDTTVNENWIKQATINLETNAIHIGAGYGDADVDDANYREYVIEWDDTNKPVWKDYFVIPGSSIKGAVSHRIAYNYNLAESITVENILANAKTILFEKKKKEIDVQIEKLKNELKFIDGDFEDLDIEQLKANAEKLKALKQQINDISINTNFDQKLDLLKEETAEKNKAESSIFGLASENNKGGKIGSIIFNDVYLPIETETIFTHNKIDRFTGGTIDTALYAEKVYATDKVEIIYLLNNIDEDFENLIDETLNELKEGDLALGGKTNKGYGFFNEKTA